MKISKKLNYQLSIGFLIASMIFSSLAPSAVWAQEVPVAETIQPAETVIDVPLDIEPMVESPLNIDAIIDSPIINSDPLEELLINDDIILTEDIADVGELINPDDIQQLAESTSVEDSIPSDPYANRDNSGLQPRSQIGTYNVDEFTGVFSYSIPIEIPQGRNGLQPAISLNYNHRRQNIGSMFGFGWELNIPNIERENRTGIDKLYDENYFLLNGDRLEPISVDSNGYGTYGKLIEDDFSKIEFSSANKWAVTDKLGTIYTYGSSVSARQDNPNNSSQVYKWLLEEVRDTNDNFISYQYYKDSGQIYPKKIIYTGHGTTDGIFEIDFEPFANGTPTVNNILSISYDTGFAVQTKYLVDKVDIKIDGSLVTSYDLGFLLNNNGNKYLLNAVIPKYYKDGLEDIKDGLEFNYAHHDTTYSLDDNYSLPAGRLLGETVPTFDSKRDMFIDLNGDSYIDYIYIYCSTNSDVISVSVYEGDGNNNWTSSNYSRSISMSDMCNNLYGVNFSIPVSFAELNGDHLIDMITNDTFYINNGNGWNPEPGSPPVSLYHSSDPDPLDAVIFQDMNADGYDDVIYNDNKGTADSEIRVFIRDLSTGGWLEDSDYNLVVNVISQACLDYGGSPFGFADLNGDNLLDIFYSYNCDLGDSYVGSGTYLNNGSSFVLTTDFGPAATMSQVSYSSTIHQYVNYVGDFNGDGVLDGGGYQRSKGTNNNGPISQGSMGLLGQEVFSTNILFSAEYFDNTLPVAITDINGDQIQDIIHSYRFSGVDYNDVYIGRSDKLDVLDKISYQSGSKVNIYYDYSAREEDNLNNLLNPALPFNLYIVKEVVVGDGLDNWQGYKYTYSDGDTISFPENSIKDLFGFSKIIKETGQARPNVDLGDGSDGDFVSSGNVIWDTDKNFTSLNIQAGHTITVKPDVVIKVQGDVIINGTLSAEGQGYAGGVAGFNGGSNGDGFGGGQGGYASWYMLGGGGGAGHVVDGLPGYSTYHDWSRGGISYGFDNLEPIYSGSGGGGGHGSTGYAGNGGNGGGIIQLFANNIKVNGEINADGQDGGNGVHIEPSDFYHGGGGGGSGGSIYIKAVYIADIGDDLVHAYGGQGGEGGNPGFNPGGDGSDGRVRVDAASVIGTSQPAYYYKINNFIYSIDNSNSNEKLQKRINYYHTAKNNGLHLHGRVIKQEFLDNNDNIIKKQFYSWQENYLDGNRKFVNLANNTEADVYISSGNNTGFSDFNVDTNTVALWGMNGLPGSLTKRFNDVSVDHIEEFGQPISSFDKNSSDNNGGYYLDGVDDYLSVTSSDLRFDRNDFSIELWFRTTSSGTIFYKWENGGNRPGYILRVGNDGRLAFSISEGNDAAVFTAFSLADVRDNLWHYVVAVREAQTLKLYLDGAQEGIAGSAYNYYVGNDQPFKVGVVRETGVSSEMYIDEIRVSNIARSSTEIQNYYTSGLPSPITEYNSSIAKGYLYNSNNGNIEVEHNFGQVEINIDTGQIINTLSGDEKYTNYQYAQNTTKNILSAPKTKIISDSVDSKQQDLYYDEMPLGQVDKVNLTKEDYIADDVEINRSFNDYGLVDEQIDPQLATTTIDYDTYNMYPYSTTDPLGNITYTQYNLFNGQIATSTDSNGSITVNEYDNFGRLIKVKITDPNNSDQLVTKKEIIYNDEAAMPLEDTGWVYPTQTGAHYNTFEWPANGYFSDDGYTTKWISNYDSNQSYEGFNFSIPTNVEILGMEIAVEHKVSGSINADEFVAYYNGDTQTWSEKSYLNSLTTDHIDIIGSSNFFPGAVLSRDFLNSGNFSVYYGGFKNASISQDTKVYLDNIKVKVYYEQPASFGSPRYKQTKDYFDTNNYVTSREYYDGLDRVIQTKTQTATTNEYSTVDISYDSQGRVERQSLPYITTTLDYTTPNLSQAAKIYTYDALDRVVTETTPVGTTSYDYDGFTTTITDANNHIKELTKDAYGNLIEVKEHNDSSTYTTSYDYSLTNKLEKITDSQGNIRNFHYDALDNLDWQDMVHLSSATSTPQINYTHDKNGNILTETSFKGDNISYVYDDLNRVLFEKLDDVNQISYTYDLNGDIGQLSSVVYADGNSRAYDYDILGNLKHSTTTIEGEVFTMHFDYNLNGDIKSITYPNNFVVTYGLNNIGQVETVSLNQGQGNTVLVENIDYNQNGQMTHLERSNGVDTDYTYDPEENFRLTDLDTGILQNIHYDYDAVGNITQITDNSTTALAKTVLYDYDDLNRLASSTVNYPDRPEDNYSLTYDYDSIGNMTYNSDLGTLLYNNSNPHQLSTYASTTLSYDNAGNTLDNDTTNFYWDWRNRLKKSTDIASDNHTYYEYDHNNQRLLKYTDDYVFVPGPVIEPPIADQINATAMFRMATDQQPGGGYWTWRRIKEDKYVDNYFEQNKANQNKTHILLNGIKIATVNHTDNPYFILSDHLGSSSILTTSTGTIAEMTDYLPYGKINYEQIITNLASDYTFTGKEYDEENALQYFGARYMDNEVGRFNSIDPILVKVDSIHDLLSDPQQLNSYAYSRNNPIIFVDPDGNAITFSQILSGYVGYMYDGTKVVGQYVGGATIGVGKEAGNIVDNVVHPIRTVKETGALFQQGYEAGKELTSAYINNPDQTMSDIKQGLGMSTNEWMDKSAFDQGQDMGKVGLDAYLMGKSTNLKGYKNGYSIGIKGESLGISADLFTGAKGAGVSIRNFNKSSNYYKTRVVGLDVHNINVFGFKNIKLPHLDFGSVKHFPWSQVDKLINK